MSFSVGIIGLPNVGKTTLLNALARLHAPVANYPFTTVEPNVGVVAIPDARLDAVARTVGSAKVTPATIEIVDVAGLVKGAHRGEGLGNEFLSHLRPMDALLHVVRAFDDPNVVRAGSTTPAEDVAVIQEELHAKDEEIAARQQQEARWEVPTKEHFADKPTLTVFNVSEERLASPPPALRALTERFAPAVTLSAKIEAELAELPDSDRETFLRAYDLDRPQTADMLSSLISHLSLITFFTANENEARAWLVPAGTKLAEAAGSVHTDFAERFIRAEVIYWEDLVAAGSATGAHERGLARDEGRETPVREGTVITVKT